MQFMLFFTIAQYNTGLVVIKYNTGLFFTIAQYNTMLFFTEATIWTSLFFLFPHLYRGFPYSAGYMEAT